jgi:hypothetical protein
MDINQYGDNLYIHISSKDSKDYFPNNKVAHFRVKLGRPLNLQGSWVVGLCEIQLRNLSNKAALVLVDDNAPGRGDDTGGVEEPDIVNLRVECSICMGLIVGGVQTRTLRTLMVKGSLYKVFPLIYYLPVETRYTDTLEFRILNSNGQLATFDEVNGMVEMTLRLKTY